VSIKLFNNPILERALDASWVRNEAISDNIANIDTPGYKRKDVNFDDYLKAAMNKDTISGLVSDPRHIKINGTSDDSESNGSGVSGSNMKFTTDYSSTSMRMDGNNVDVDTEMAELAKNQILYDAYSTLINKDYGMLRSAIREGR